MFINLAGKSFNHRSFASRRASVALISCACAVRATSLKSAFALLKSAFAFTSVEIDSDSCAFVCSNCDRAASKVLAVATVAAVAGSSGAVFVA